MKKTNKKTGDAKIIQPEINLWELNINQLQQLTGFDRNTISEKLTKANLPFKNGTRSSKIYNSADAIKILFQKNESEETELNQSKERLAKAKAELAELELAKQKGLFVETSLILTEIENEYSTIRAQLRSLPSKLTKWLSIETDPQKINQILTDAIEETLIELKTDAESQIQNLNSENPEIENEDEQS